MPVHTVAKANILSHNCFEFIWKHFDVSEDLTEENLMVDVDGDDSLVETIAEVGLERVQIEEEEEAGYAKIDNEDKEVDDDTEGNGKKVWS